MDKNRIPQQYAEKYLLGGKARVVFYNTETKEQRKFSIIQWRDGQPKFSIFSDDYPLPALGIIKLYPQGPELIEAYAGNRKTKVELDLLKNFSWVWKKIRTLTVPDTLHILHLGRCSVCGRLLTDAVSLERGIGPKCAGL